MNNVNLKIIEKYRKIIILLVFFIMFIGIVFLGSVSQPISLKTYENTLKIYNKQFIILIAGFVISFITYLLYKTEIFIKNYKVLTISAIIFIFIFLLSPFVPGLGKTVKGATRWINVGINIQPSEVVKPIIILCTASILKFSDKKEEMITMLFILLIVSLLPIYLQKSNTSMLQIALIIFLMFCHTDKIEEIYKFLFSFIGGSFVLTFFALKKIIGGSYVSSRLDNFIKGTSVQANASVTAIKLGGLTGVGIGEGTQKYFFLPEAHNDYIFAAISEEAGFFVSIIILLSFCALILLMFITTKYLNSELNKYICYGVIYNITNQFIGNILINLNIVPSTGITLPFISSGGSSLIANFMCIALFLACVDLEIRKENK